MNSRGFTLLEVLIAIAVLSITMLGIYRMSFVSVSTSNYAKSRAYVDEQCYLRVLEKLNFPNYDFKDEITNDGIKINFTNTKKDSIYSGVQEVKQTAETSDAKAVYYYYEQD